MAESQQQQHDKPSGAQQQNSIFQLQFDELCHKSFGSKLEQELKENLNTAMLPFSAVLVTDVESSKFRINEFMAHQLNTQENGSLCMSPDVRLRAIQGSDLLRQHARACEVLKHIQDARGGFLSTLSHNSSACLSFDEISHSQANGSGSSKIKKSVFSTASSSSGDESPFDGHPIRLFGTSSSEPIGKVEWVIFLALKESRSILDEYYSKMFSSSGSGSSKGKFTVSATLKVSTSV